MKYQDPDWQWLDSIEVLTLDGDFESRTGDVESLVITLTGTFDVLAGGGSWMARGVRTSPLEGKPVALFLPPDTPFAFHNGTGELLCIRGRQPEQQPDPGEATSQKPLLALAGSGKAFDPATGAWKREEDFPSSPEAILPRRVELTETAGCTVRHVFPFDYKALCLSMDEIVLRAGATTTIPVGEVDGYPMERALYYDAPAPLTVGGTTVEGRGIVADVPPETRILASVDTYLALACAGPKLPA